MSMVGPEAECPFCHYRAECTKFGKYEQRLWKCICGAFAAGAVIGDANYAQAAEEIVVRLKLKPLEDDVQPTHDFVEINRRMQKALQRDGYRSHFCDVSWTDGLELSLIWVMKPGCELLPLKRWKHAIELTRQPSMNEE